MAYALVRSDWVDGNLVFKEKVAGNAGQVRFGIDASGLDVVFFGATTAYQSIWDESADGWVMSGADLNFTGTRGAVGLLDVDGTATYFADFAAAGAGGISLTADGMSQDPDTASEDGFIAILVGASIYEIPIWLRT